MLRYVSNFTLRVRHSSPKRHGASEPEVSGTPCERSQHASLRQIAPEGQCEHERANETKSQKQRLRSVLIAALCRAMSPSVRTPTYPRRPVPTGQWLG